MPSNQIDLSWVIYPPTTNGGTPNPSQQNQPQVEELDFDDDYEEFLPITTGLLKRKKHGTGDGEEELDIYKSKMRDIFPYHFNNKAFPTVDTVKALKDYIGYVNSEKGPERLTPNLPVIRNGEGVLVGLEIEIENSVSSKWGNSMDAKNELSHHEKCHQLVGKVWITHEDGSLRNKGMEFVSRVGLTAVDVPSALELLNCHLAANFSDPQITFRCGTHVHVDIRDFKVSEFLSFVLLYTLFEDLFYEVSGKRYRNIYCVPLRASHTNLAGLLEYIDNPSRATRREFRDVMSGFQKYMGFNLCPAGFYVDGKGALGTVEFRHHEGCADPVRLSHWVQFIVDLHYAARSIPLSELKELIFKLNGRQNYEPFVNKVFTQLPRWIKMQDVVNDMYTGSAYIKSTYIAAKEAA